MKRKMQKWLIRFLRFLGAVFFLYLILKIFTNGPFLVKNIIVTTDYNVTDNPKIWEALNKQRGKNLLTLNGQKTALEIKNLEIQIKSVDLKKEFPGKILVKILKRQAIATISIGQSFLLVDGEGLIFAKREQMSNLPELFLNLQKIEVGSRIDKDRENILKILAFISDKEKINAVWEKETNLELKSESGILIIMPIASDQAKLSSLQMILNRFKIEGKSPSKIDLQFEKPVVVF